MTREDAIAYLQYGEPYGTDYLDAIETVVEALKAQEPVEPQEKREGDYRNLYCGACGRGYVGYIEHFTVRHLKVNDYCCKCGKKVKWND